VNALDPRHKGEDEGKVVHALTGSRRKIAWNKLIQPVGIPARVFVSGIFTDPQTRSTDG
jgi:hypothetical protein